MINDEERNATRDSLHSYSGASDQFLKTFFIWSQHPPLHIR